MTEKIKNVLWFLLALAVASTVMLALRAYVVTVYTVTGNGLSPDLQSGDRVIVNRISPHHFNHGDIVVFGHPKAIGRVVAGPGDTVSIGARRWTIVSHCTRQCDCKACSHFLISTGKCHTVVNSADIIGKAYRIYPLKR